MLTRNRTALAVPRFVLSLLVILGLTSRVAAPEPSDVLRIQRVEVDEAADDMTIVGQNTTVSKR